MKHLYAFVQFFLFNRFPRIYKLLYFFYKRVSDKDLRKWMEDNIEEGMTVLDIGGNIGDTADYLSKLVGEKGKVYSFEPDPTNFKHLITNIDGLENVIAENVAVGDKNTKIQLYINDSLNVDHQTYDSGEGRESIEVQCVTIDEYLKGKKVDFIKIDVQGFDYHAMLGAKETLRNNDIRIIGEFWPYGLLKAAVQPKEYLDLLTGLGYKVELEDGALDKEKESDLDYYTNFLAEKNEKATL